MFYKVMRRYGVAGAACLAAIALFWMFGRPARSRYAGSASCRECHAQAWEDWRRSDHAHAMQPLDRPLRVPVGSETFEAAYAIGRDPFEQYLVATSKGRLQATSVAWDPAAREWFDVFADDPRSPGDWGHWLGRGMNANAMCVTCHATGYDKGYDTARDSYASSWSELGVGCESCHGPGEAHVAWARGGGKTSGPKIVLAGGIDTCAACHSRRGEIDPDFVPGRSFTDHFMPELLDSEAAYYADGQVRGESYEYGSFLQSRMYHKGVRCGDCHHPHTQELLARGNALCLRCHKPELDTLAHTRHPAGSAGAQCVSCHMPETTYLMRDARRDHSFSIPVPAHTEQLGIPNACNRCHADKSAAWASDLTRHWFGHKERVETIRTRAFALGRKRDPAALPDLMRILGDESLAAVHRACAARLLGAYEPTEAIRSTLVRALGDPDPLVREGAVVALGDAPETAAALNDLSRLVRIRAAWAVRRDQALLPGRDRAEAELVRAMELASDQAEALFHLGVYWSDRGRLDRALDCLERALAIAPNDPTIRATIAKLKRPR